MSTSSITPHRRDISASQRSGFSSQHEAGRGSPATLSSMRRPTSTLRLPSNQCLPPYASAPGARSSRSDSPVLGPRVMGGAMRSFVRGVSGSSGALGRRSRRVVRQSQKTSPIHDRCAGSRTGTLAPIQHPAAHPTFSSFHCRLNTDELEASATFDAPGHLDALRRHEGRMCSSSGSAARAHAPAASTDRPLPLSRSLPPPSSGCAVGAAKYSDAKATSAASRSSGTMTEDANSHSFLSSLEEHFLRASAVTNDEDLDLSSIVGQNGELHDLQSKRLRRNSAGQACDMLLDAGTATGSSVRSVDDMKLAEVEALMGRLMLRWRHLRGSELLGETGVERPAAGEPTAAASTMAAAAAPAHAAPSFGAGFADGEDDAFKERIMRFLESQYSQYYVQDTAGPKRARSSLPLHKRVQALDDDACEGEIAAALKRGVQGSVSANPFTPESIEERFQNGGARVPHDKMFMSRLDQEDASDELEDDMSPLGSVSAGAYSAQLGIEIEEGSMGQSSCSSPVSLTEGGSWASCHRSCSPTGAGRLKQGSEVYKHAQQRPVNPAMPRKVKAIRSPIVTTELTSPDRSKSVASLCSPRSAFSPHTPRSCTSSAY